MGLVLTVHRPKNNEHSSIIALQISSHDSSTNDWEEKEVMWLEVIIAELTISQKVIAKHFVWTFCHKFNGWWFVQSMVTMVTTILVASNPQD